MSYKYESVVNVIGHINPDTDSVCSAIAYANLKSQSTGEKYIPKRAGQINAETQFVLKHFGVSAPDYMGDVRTQVIDIDVQRVTGVSQEISLKRAWELMKTDTLQTLPIVDASQKLLGLITIEDIAKSYMDVYDSRIISKAGTPFHNIVETLDGDMIHGDMDEEITSGKCLIAAANPDLMESYIEKDDIVILGNRYESQLCAIEMGAKCIIVCDGALVSYTISRLAESRGCYIIKTPYDTFTASRLINQSIPIRFFMKSENLITFGLGEYLDDIRDTMAKKRYRDFPILDWNENYFGMISRRSLLGARKKKLILVDHNELTQAVDGMEEAEIIEIIDHHRIGSIETMGPVFFRNQPVGCTATIITQLYDEKGVVPDRKIAGLLASAIISDTLMFRSPTCTALDRATCERLADMAGINITEMANNMFRAASSLQGKTPEEICYQDFKIFNNEGRSFGVSQVTSMDSQELDSIREKVKEYLPQVMEQQDLDMMFMMMTNIVDTSTELLCCGLHADLLAKEAFDIADGDEHIILKDIVSCKKQFLPAFVEALHQ